MCSNYFRQVNVNVNPILFVRMPAEPVNWRKIRTVNVRVLALRFDGEIVHKSKMGRTSEVIPLFAVLTWLYSAFHVCNSRVSRWTYCSFPKIEKSEVEKTTRTHMLKITSRATVRASTSILNIFPMKNLANLILKAKTEASDHQ